MGKQNQYENNPEEIEIRDQVRDLKEDGYEAEEIVELLESNGYEEEEYREIMESEGLTLPEWDEDGDSVDMEDIDMWAEDIDTDTYDDEYGENEW